MLQVLRLSLGILILAEAPLAAPARQGPDSEPLQPAVPLRPLSQRAQDRQEALRQHARGLLCLREDRLLEATQAFELAARLDPTAPDNLKALAPLYAALGRMEDAVAACRRTVELAPEDVAAWQLLGQYLRARGDLAEARAAFEKALACPAVGEQADVALQLHLHLADLSEDLKEPARAIPALRAAVRILERPEQEDDAGVAGVELRRERITTAYERIIRLCLQARQPEEALRTFHEARKRYPQLADRLSLVLAQVLAAQGRPAEALHQLEEHLRTQPQGTEGYELKMKLLEELQRPADIVPALQAAARRDPHNAALKLLLARARIRAGDYSRAEEELLQLAAQGPTPEVYRELFRLYKERRRIGDALNLLNQALEQAADRDKPPGAPLPPEDPVAKAEGAARARAMLAVLRDNRDLAQGVITLGLQRSVERGDRLHQQTRYHLAVLASHAGMLDEAERFYRQCLRQLGDRPIAEHSIYGGLIEVLFRARKFHAVVEVCQHGIERVRQTNLCYLYFRLTQALLLLGRHEQALEAADKTVALANEEAVRLDAQLLRIRVLAAAGREQEALAEGETLLKAQAAPGPRHQVCLQLASLYHQVRDFERSEDLLLRVLRDDPDNSQANNDLGYYWADRGKNLDDAERMIRKAIRLYREESRGRRPLGATEDNAAYLDSLGWVLFRRGQLEEARQWLEKAAALEDGQDNAEVWDHLGDVYYRLEKVVQAGQAWKKAEALYQAGRSRPTEGPLREVREKLRLLAGSSGQP